MYAPKLEGAEAGEDKFEGEVGPLESDRCDSNSSSAIDSWVPDSSFVRRVIVCLMP